LPRGNVKGNIDAELVLYTMIEYENYENKNYPANLLRRMIERIDA
jgi:hypothetical protein